MLAICVARSTESNGLTSTKERNYFDVKNIYVNNIEIAFLHTTRRECQQHVSDLWGPLDREQWANDGKEPVCLEDCIRVALHFVADKIFIPTSFIRIIKHPEVINMLNKYGNNNKYK